MKKHLCIPMILFFIVFISCKNDQKSGNPLKTIDLAANISKIQQVNLSQFTDEIKYIPLESRDSALLRDDPPFDISDEFIITTDGDACLLYDLSGHFIRRFGTKGRGPDEFQFISNITISENKKIYFNSDVDLFEFNINGSLAFKLSNALLINDKYRLMNWHLVDDSLILGHIDNNRGQEEIKAMLINLNNTVKQKYRNYDLIEFQGSRVFNGSPRFYKFNGSVFFKEQFNDTLFSLNKKYELIPRYSFNLGNLGVTKAERGKHPTINSDYLFIFDIFQTERYLFLNISRQSKNPSSVFGIFNKEIDELVFSKPTDTDNSNNKSGIFNDIDAGPRFSPKRMVNDFTLASTITAKQLKDHVASDYFKNSKPRYPEKKKQLEDLAKSITEFDNPILMMVTFKK
jgi:hypothetical protein